MLKYGLIIFFILCIFGAFALLLSRVLTTDVVDDASQKNGQPQTTETPPVMTTPSAPSVVPAKTQMMAVRARDGSTFTVHDVRKDIGVRHVATDINNPYYILPTRFGGVGEVNSYAIFFFEKTGQFTIMLTGNPLPEFQKNAEHDLLAQLRVTKEALCRVRVDVVAAQGEVSVPVTDMLYLCAN